MAVLTAEEVARWCREAGFTGEALVTIVAIARAESGFDASVLGDIGLQDDTWGPSVGLLQIRSLKKERGTGGTRDELANLSPAANARAAWEISSHGRVFTPWSVFGSGAYRNHLADVRPACQAVDQTVPAGEGPPFLQQGSEGDAVADLQRRLSEAGFPCGADGQFGPRTEQAVRDFQAARGLEVDGVVGPQTWAALTAGGAGVEGRPLLQEGDAGDAVADLQRLLTGAGFPCAGDGHFGPRTGQAVRDFQASAGLDADGVVGPRTWAALLRVPSPV